VTTIVDAHHHLWDPANRAYPWLAKAELDPIRQRYDVDDLRRHTTAAGVDATVLVQTVSDVSETIELLDAAEKSAGLVAGVVGWVDLTGPDVGDVLSSLAAHRGGQRLVGVRHQVEDERDPLWLNRGDVGRGLAAVARAGLVYDLLVPTGGLAVATAAVGEHATLEFVLDHAAKPPVAGGDLDAWRRGIAELARRENVAVKLSGLVTEADWQAWTIDDLRPVIDHVLATFGPSRMMFGSDWPVCELAASYEDVAQTARDLVAELSSAERDDVFGGTACRVYRILT